MKSGVAYMRCNTVEECESVSDDGDDDGDGDVKNAVLAHQMATKDGEGQDGALTDARDDVHIFTRIRHSHGKGIRSALGDPSS